jgi:hypothetical protein
MERRRLIVKEIYLSYFLFWFPHFVLKNFQKKKEAKYGYTSL